MPTFRCPKCRARLSADGSKPTVKCSQCGQLCAIPVQAAPPPPAQLQAAPPQLPPPLKMDDVIETDDEVLDIVEVPDEDGDVMDVVAAGDGDAGPKARRRKTRKKGPRYKKSIWYGDDDRSGGSMWINASSITAAILVVIGFALTFASFYTGTSLKLLFTYSIAMQIIAIIWGISLGMSDGEGTAIIFWVYRWIYLIQNLDRGLWPMIVEVVGIILMLVAWVS
jgi:hypothetical protein